MSSQDQELQPAHEVSFDRETGYLVVQLHKGSYGLKEAEVIYQGKTFQPKDELHITIVSSDAAEAVQEHLEQQPQGEGQIRQLIEANDWSYQKLNQFYHVEAEPGVESIIQMVKVPGLEQFFHELSRIVGKELSLPPTHVTLYTLGDPQGIGLPTQSVFEQRVRSEIRPEALGPQGSA